MKLLPRTEMTATWRECPGDRTQLKAMADLIEELGRDGADVLRKLVSVWNRLPLSLFPYQHLFTKALHSFPLEWCGVAAFGIAARCSLWLGDRFDPLLGELVEDLTEVPEEDQNWDEFKQKSTRSPTIEDCFRGLRDLQIRALAEGGHIGGQLGARAREAGKRTHKAIQEFNETRTVFRETESVGNRPDPGRAELEKVNGWSYGVCASGRIAKMRIWRGQRHQETMRNAVHPVDLLASCALEASKSRCYANGLEHTSERGRELVRREHFWQAAWLLAVATVAGDVPRELANLVGYADRKRINKILGD